MSKCCARIYWMSCTRGLHARFQRTSDKSSVCLQIISSTRTSLWCQIQLYKRLENVKKHKAKVLDWKDVVWAAYLVSRIRCACGSLLVTQCWNICDITGANQYVLFLCVGRWRQLSSATNVRIYMTEFKVTHLPTSQAEPKGSVRNSSIRINKPLHSKEHLLHRNNCIFHRTFTNSRKRSLL
jgi:hypothetical protein